MVAQTIYGFSRERNGFTRRLHSHCIKRRLFDNALTWPPPNKKIHCPRLTAIGCAIANKKVFHAQFICPQPMQIFETRSAASVVSSESQKVVAAARNYRNFLLSSDPLRYDSYDWHSRILKSAPLLCYCLRDLHARLAAAVFLLFWQGIFDESQRDVEKSADLAGEPVRGVCQSH